MIKRYTLEELGPDGRWHILGERDSNALAQSDMRRQMQLFPKAAFRVVENPSRQLQVCYDPQVYR